MDVAGLARATRQELLRNSPEPVPFRSSFSSQMPDMQMCWFWLHTPVVHVASA